MNTVAYNAAYELAYEAELRRSKRNEIRRRNRIRQIRRRIVMVLLTLVLVIFLSVSYHAFLSEANTEEASSFKYYTSIEVAYGETLTALAEQYAGEEYASYADYISEVMQINHLKEESITAGQYLVIPYYAEEFVK